MSASINPLGRVAARLTALLALAWLAACAPVPGAAPGGNSGPRIDPGSTVQVALLVPGGSGDGADQLIATNLENAARMAIADLGGAQIDLRVYNTGANPAQAASIATAAVDDGAQIILGPLYAEAANAVGVTVAPRNVNVLTFSNNPTIAGGNVFLLGSTFENTANRLVNFAARSGITRFAVVHADDLQGNVGRDAITAAVSRNRAQLAGVASYPLSQQGILDAAPQIAATVKAGGADAVFLTASISADLPIIATALPDAGVNPLDTKFIGLTRWNALPQALALPGLQGGLFALPDQAVLNSFEGRYAATYGAAPHPLAGLAYDGIAAIGALLQSGNAGALTRQGLTTSQGFQGANGIFRFLPNGQSERGLAVAEIRNNQVVILDPAPRSFGGSGL